MKITVQDSVYSISAISYALAVDENGISVILAGEEVAKLKPSSPVDVTNRNITDPENDPVSFEDIPGSLTFSVREEADRATFTWRGATSLWDKVEYVLTAMDTHFEYYARVTGKGDVDSVCYFLGDRNGRAMGSSFEFDRGFAPISYEDGSDQSTFICNKSYEKYSTMMIPNMFVYTFETCGIDKLLALGLAAEEGEHNFVNFDFRVTSPEGRNRFWMQTNQDGHTHVDGTWVTPRIICCGVDSREAGLKFYSDYYFDRGIAKRKAETPIPRWWRGPIACGWTEQSVYAAKHGCPMANACEDVYNGYLRDLKKRDLHPSLLIIDDKWMDNYGLPHADKEKWPDLRGWIDRNLEENGIHTMLWFMMWDVQGLPEEVYIHGERNPYWNNHVCDPSHPKFRELLRETIHRLLSSDEGCYNAYGLKVDYAFYQPIGRNFKTYSGKYGAELLFDYMKDIYTFAKEAKPDAIVNNSVCHPIFHPYVDHARLHDYENRHCCYEEFKFRKEIYEIAIPGALIDTDGASHTAHRDTYRYLRLSHTLGIPALYCISPTPTMEMTDKEWATISSVWREYSEEQDGLYE